jgi:Tol biopolymer transport system component
MKIIILVIAAGLMLFVTACDTVDNELDKPNFRGKVVYVIHYYDSDRKELAVMNIDGTNRKVIDTAEKIYINLSEPSWSKDGKKILYTVARNLFLINEDGTSRQDLKAQLQVLTPRFSSDEKYIVYNLFGSSPERPVLFDIAGGKIIKQLYETSNSQDFGPNPWTKDNQKVLLHAQLERNGNYGLYFVDIISGGIDTVITSPQRLFNRPLISNDETEIIYSTTYSLLGNYGSFSRLNVKTKKSIELKFSIPNLRILHPKYWTQDKRYLLFTVKNESSNEFIADLLYHDFMTGKTDYLLKNISYDIDVWLEE